MGVYTRRDSPYYWLWLERAGARALRERTAILRDAPTASQRQRQRELAEDAYRVRMSELARGTYALPGARPSLGFREYADWYEAHITIHQAGAVREREILKTLRAYFGGTALTDLTKARVREWMTERASTVSVATVNRELDLLKSMLREACPRYLTASPIAGLKRLRPRKATSADALDDEIRILSHDEEARLLAALRDPRDRVLILAALDTLARLSSLLALTWRDDRGSHLVMRRPKSGRTYKVPISTRLRAALDSLPDRDATYIFAHRRGEKVELRRSAIKNLLVRTSRRAGLVYGRRQGGFTFHSFRHTGASRMIAKGVDLRTVQDLGGWSDIRLLMRYVHPTDASKRAAVERVSEP